LKFGLYILFLINTVNLLASNKNDVNQYVENLKKITDVMVYDVTSPVASARYYAYTTLASYEILSLLDSIKYPSILSNLTHGIKLKRSNGTLSNQNLNVTVTLTLLKTANLLLPSGSKLTRDIESLAKQLPLNQRKDCEAIADYVSTTIQKWANTDGFLQLANLRKYTPKRGIGYWQPTAPAFMAPIEPHWHNIRTFFLDSAQQFRPPVPTKYDENENSPFILAAKDVYDSSKNLTKEQIHMANFWDCNPYMIQQIGHVEFGVKKISPGGHWMGIAGIVCKKKKVSFDKMVLTHTLLAMSLHDAFVACWDEKYHSERIRPETVINKLIDKTWRPLLQTPPFPEYVSGHSVASTTSSILLTKLLGENVKFTDDTEVEFGIKKRKFSSFKQAAEEASISRFYGGIHYKDGIENGIWQGEQVGEFIITQVTKYLSI
jgi:hypothetical protein